MASSPDTPEGWLSLVAQHEQAARLLAEDRKVANQGFWHAGTATECALKAFIMRKERLNGWPSKESRPELWTHDLRQLVKAAGIKLDPKAPEGPSWHVVLQWDRNQGYDPNKMPRTVARAMVEATFGDQGVVTWIRQNLM